MVGAAVAKAAGHNGRMPRPYARTRFAALVATVAGLAAAILVAGLPRPATLAEVAAAAGTTGPVLAVLGSGLLVAAMIPRAVLAVAAGLLFGPLAGATYVLLGAAIGASAAFGVGRLLGRDFVSGAATTSHPDGAGRPDHPDGAGRRDRAGARLAALDGWLANQGVLGVLLLRLLPIAPFGLVSYAFGATGVRLRAYLVGTAAGMTPSTVIYASLGANALEPGTTGFAVSVAAAVMLAVAGMTAPVLISRRRRRRESTPI